jgi:uncharacterized protein YkwD
LNPYGLCVTLREQQIDTIKEVQKMKKFIITSVCTLGLTLLGAFGSYQSSNNLSNNLNAVKQSTIVEENVTNTDIQQSLPITTTAVKGAVDENTDNKEVKTVQTSSKKKSEVKKNKKKAKKNSKKNTKKTKTTKNNSNVKAANTTKATAKKPSLTYKNVDLSNCDNTKEVVIKLQNCGYKNITMSNVDDIKSLEDILAYINKNGSKATPTTKPEATTKPTPTKAPAATTKPTPTKTPTATTKPTPTTQPSNPSDVSSYANQVLQLVNKERAKAGLSALTTNSALTNAANKRAKETVQSFSHTRPDGSNFSTVLKEFSISYRTAGENIAYGQKTPQEVVTGWMNSPGHRANILNANFGKIGIGVYKSNGVIYWSQLFTN